MGYETFEELIDMSHYGTSQILKDFRVTKTYEPYNIRNCKFYEFDAEYLFEHVDIDEPLKVELKVLKESTMDFITTLIAINQGSASVLQTKKI